jgi:hypothetical protein
VQIIVKVKPEDTQALQQGQAATEGARRLLHTAQELDVTLEPVHPGESDPSLAPYFAIEVADPDQAEKVRARFDSLNTTEAAYLKPPDYLP